MMRSRRRATDLTAILVCLPLRATAAFPSMSGDDSEDMEYDSHEHGSAFGSDYGKCQRAREMPAAARCAPVLPLSQRKIHTRGDTWAFPVGWDACRDPAGGAGVLCPLL